MKIKFVPFFKRNYAFSVILVLPLIAACSSGRDAYDNSPEAMERREHMVERIYQNWDLNEDNEITCDDAAMQLDHRFKSADLNEDGKLALSEFQKASWSNRAYAAEHLYLFDQNNDGSVNFEEFKNRPDPKFKAMDRDNNCLVTKQEILKMMADARHGARGFGGRYGLEGRGERSGGRGEGREGPGHENGRD